MTVVLEVHAARTYFTGPEPQLERMFECLRLRDKSAWFKANATLRRLGYFRNVRDREERAEKIGEIREGAKWIKFYSRRTDSFASGLLSRVKKHLSGLAVPFEVEDCRRQTPDLDKEFALQTAFSFRDTIESRPEQFDVVLKALQKKRGLLNCATNSGKTEVACAIVAEYHRQTKVVPRVLFLIHRASLARQTRKRFHRHLSGRIPVLLAGAGSREIPRIGVLVATTQTASRLVEAKNTEFRKFLEQCDIAFVDELHINKAASTSRIMDNCAASMRYGLSGTIDTSNQAKMLHYIGMTGPIIAEISNRELVQLGRSARPFIRFVEVHAGRVSGNYGYSYQRGVVRCRQRNRLILRETLRHVGKERATLITVSRVSHGKILQRLLESATDVRCEFIWGKTPLRVREEAVKEFERGNVAILIASEIFNVGMDVPSIEAWVNAAGGLGWELVLQRLGRVLRRKKGANRVYISDFVDLHNEYLLAHSLARIRHYQKEEIAKIRIVEA